MTEEISIGLISSFPSRVVVPSSLPLVSLSLYLFLEFESDKDRTEQLDRLFYNYKSLSGQQELEKIVLGDPKSANCYEAAKKRRSMASSRTMIRSTTLKVLKRLRREYRNFIQSAFFCGPKAQVLLFRSMSSMN